MEMTPDRRRRSFLTTAGKITAGAALISGTAMVTAAQGNKDKAGGKPGPKEEDVGPTEDLMREHGVLNRVLLIYDHFMEQLDQKQTVKPEMVNSAATIIRKFVEDYHEKQEEDFLFPRFEKAKVLTGLVPVLKSQHQAGRILTDRIISLAKSTNADDKLRLAQSLRSFVHMYRPHEAREDTILFPQLRKIVSPNEFDSLGEQFESNEHKQFGADGFELYRDKVAEIEKQLGIYDLAQFTPKV